MKTLRKIIDNIDLKETLSNIGLAWGAGTLANLSSNSFFRYDLNKYNSVNHFTAGVGMGTFFYTGFGKGWKGITAGLIAVTLANAGWELFENLHVFDTNLLSIDTMTDIAVVYAGSVLSFVGEKLKESRKKRGVL